MFDRFAPRLVSLVLLVATTLLAAPAAAQQPTPLFAGDEILRITIRGPIGAIRRGAERGETPHPAMLTLEGARPETHAIMLSARGISRRRREICQFPPLRVELAAPPAAGSLFEGQRRLKLVTHCRPAEAYQNHLLLEYAAYRLFNAITPISYRARLARIDYVEAEGERPFATRLGFFIEDVDDAARRNGLVEIETGDFSPRRLDPRGAARSAVFQYMIGNLDWAMEAGPEGEQCCHNSRPLAAARGATDGLIPMPYDFDGSGLVDAPYAAPPAGVPVSSVRVRRYRGFCAHNAEARAAAAEIRAARPAIEAALAAVPELGERQRARASAYLAGFFEDIATDEAVAQNLLTNCL